MFAAGRELVAPGVLGAVEPAARGEFPLRFGRQVLAGPSRVGERVAEGDMHDWMVVERVDSLFGPYGCRQSAPFTNATIRPVLQLDRTGAAMNTSEPALKLCGNAPG